MTKRKYRIAYFTGFAIFFCLFYAQKQISDQRFATYSKLMYDMDGLDITKTYAIDFYTHSSNLQNYTAYLYSYDVNDAGVRSNWQVIDDFYGDGAADFWTRRTASWKPSSAKGGFAIVDQSGQFLVDNLNMSVLLPITDGSFESPITLYKLYQGDGGFGGWKYFTDSSGWVNLIEPKGTDTAPQDGSRYVQLYDSGDQYSNLMRDFAGLDTSKSYTVSFYSHPSSDQYFTCNVMVYTHDGAGNRTGYASVYSFEQNNNDVWESRSFTWTPTSSNSGFVIYAANTQFLIDNVSMKESGGPELIDDGSFESPITLYKLYVGQGGFSSWKYYTDASGWVNLIEPKGTDTAPQEGSCYVQLYASGAQYANLMYDMNGLDITKTYTIDFYTHSSNLQNYTAYLYSYDVNDAGVRSNWQIIKQCAGDGADDFWVQRTADWKPTSAKGGFAIVDRSGQFLVDNVGVYITKVLADLTPEYAGVQGQDNWYYRTKSPGNSLAYNGTYWTDGDATIQKSGTMILLGGTNEYPSVEWSSEVTGPVRISGVFSLQDGITTVDSSVHISINGTDVFGEVIGVTNSFGQIVNVNIGDRIQFWMAPNAAGSNILVALINTKVETCQASTIYDDLSRGREILLDRGLQIQAQTFAETNVFWSITDWADSKFTTINTNWGNDWYPMYNYGDPGTFTWGRYQWNPAGNPPTTLNDVVYEGSYLADMVSWQLGDENQNGQDDMAELFAWKQAVRAQTAYDNILLYTNQPGSVYT